MNAGALLVAYHGCDAVTRDDLVSGRLKSLHASENKYDWLGSGAYFFENDAARAFMFALASSQHPEKMYTKQAIATPAMVGAVLCVSRWLDMTTQEGIRHFAWGFQSLSSASHAGGVELPRNEAASPEDQDVLLRALDSAVFNFIHKARELDNAPAFQAVRGAFLQGEEVAPSSGFYARTHVQIALRDNSCVLGWFLPPDATLMTNAQYDDAVNRRAAMQRSRKPRRVAPRAVPPEA